MEFFDKLKYKLREYILNNSEEVELDLLKMREDSIKYNKYKELIIQESEGYANDFYNKEKYPDEWEDLKNAYIAGIYRKWKVKK